MSGAIESAVEADEVCANCGTAALDDVKLKKCACDLVKYCSIECRDDHLDEHEEECKKKMNELHDKNCLVNLISAATTAIVRSASCRCRWSRANL